MNNLKESKFNPRRNETAIMYGPIPIPTVRPRIINSILTKIAKFLLGKKKKN